MRIRNLFRLCSAGCAVFLFFSAWPAHAASPVDGSEYKRIISLAPSITEILFDLGLGDRVTGVTRYCNYPPEARAKAQVGGYIDPNYEAVISLAPDLIILLEAQRESRKRIEELGFRVLTVDHLSVAGILDSMKVIGRLCGREEQAEKIIAGIEGRMNYISRKTNGLVRPRVMISIDRTLGSGAIQDVYIVGHEEFYNTLIRLAGGENAYQRKDLKFPVVSREGIIRMNPEIIIDMIPALLERGWNERDILKEWTTLPGVSAVNHSRIYAFSEDYAVRPGPRFIVFLEKLARLIHPEAAWDKP